MGTAKRKSSKTSLKKPKAKITASSGTPPALSGGEEIIQS